MTIAHMVKARETMHHDKPPILCLELVYSKEVRPPLIPTLKSVAIKGEGERDQKNMGNSQRGCPVDRRERNESEQLNKVNVLFCWSFASSANTSQTIRLLVCDPGFRRVGLGMSYLLFDSNTSTDNASW